MKKPSVKTPVLTNFGMRTAKLRSRNTLACRTVLAGLSTAILLLTAAQQAFAETIPFRPGLDINFDYQPKLNQTASIDIALPLLKFGKVQTFIDADLAGDRIYEPGFDDQPGVLDRFIVQNARIAVGAAFKSYDTEFAPSKFHTLEARIFGNQETNLKSVGAKFSYLRQFGLSYIQLNGELQRGNRTFSSFDVVETPLINDLGEVTGTFDDIVPVRRISKENKRQLRGIISLIDPLGFEGSKLFLNAGLSKIDGPGRRIDSKDAFLTLEKQFGKTPNFTNRAFVAADLFYLNNSASSVSIKVDYPVIDRTNFQLRVVPAFRAVERLQALDSRFEASLSANGYWDAGVKHSGGFNATVRRKLDFNEANQFDAQNEFSFSTDHRYQISPNWSFSQRAALNKFGRPISASYEPRLSWNKNRYFANLSGQYHRTFGYENNAPTQRSYIEFDAGYNRLLRRGANLSLSSTARIDWNEFNERSTRFGARLSLKF